MATAFDIVRPSAISQRNASEVDNEMLLCNKLNYTGSSDDCEKVGVRSTLSLCKSLLPIARYLLAYISLQLLIGILGSHRKFETYMPWVSQFYYAVAVVCATLGCYHLLVVLRTFTANITESKAKVCLPLLKLRVSAAFVALASSSASFIVSFGNVSGIFIDGWGVESPAALWSEWLVITPFIVYSMYSIERGENAKLVAIAVFVSTFFSFIMNLPGVNESSCAVLFALSSVFTIFICYRMRRMATLAFRKAAVLPLDRGEGFSIWQENTSCTSTVSTEDDNHIKGKYCLTLLVMLLFSFHFVNILGYFRTLDRDQVAVAYLSCRTVFNLMYVVVFIDSQISEVSSLESRSSTRETANDTRRAFLRYVFHELRVPLNTVTMGLAAVETEKNVLTVPVRETLSMMSSATHLMGDFLNDVLSMHTIEEGKLKLELKPFSFENMVMDAVAAFDQEIERKKINVKVNEEENRHGSSVANDEVHLVGDESHLRHALQNIISNALRMSSECTTINIQIKRIYRYKYQHMKPSESFTALNHGSFKTAIKFFNMKGLFTSVPGEISGSFKKLNPKNLMNRVNVASNNSSSNRSRDIEAPDVEESDNDDANNHNCNLSHHNSDHMIDAGSHRVCDVTVLVTNTGPGLTQKELVAMLTTPHADIQPEGNIGSADTDGRGTGLWLLLAKEIIALHGGKMILKSSQEMGSSTLGFSVPLEVVSPSPYTQTSSAVVSAQASRLRPPQSALTTPNVATVSGPQPAPVSSALAPVSALHALLGIDTPVRTACHSTPASPVGTPKVSTRIRKNPSTGYSRARRLSASDNVYQPQLSLSSSAKQQAAAPAAATDSAGEWPNAVAIAAITARGANDIALLNTSFKAQKPAQSPQPLSQDTPYVAEGKERLSSLIEQDEGGDEDKDNHIAANHARADSSPRNNYSNSNMLSRKRVSCSRIVLARSRDNSAKSVQNDEEMNNRVDGEQKHITVEEEKQKPDVVVEVNDTADAKIRLRSKAGAGTAAGNGSNASLSVDANVVDSSTGVGRGSMKGSGKSSRRSELRRISWDIQITCPEVVGKAAAGPSSAHARDKKTATWAGAGASGSRVEDMKGTAEKEKEKKEVPTPTHHRHSAPAIWPMFSTGFSAAANSSLRKARTVLVVDDTLSNSKILQMLLKKYNINSHIAMNGKEAVDAVSTRGVDKYDMIFMDYSMPVMTGVEATSHIRAMGYNNLILGVTGNVLNEDVKSFLKAGCDSVLAKPLRASQLDSIIELAECVEFRSQYSKKVTASRVVKEGYETRRRLMNRRNTRGASADVGAGDGADASGGAGTGTGTGVAAITGGDGDGGDSPEIKG